MDHPILTAVRRESFEPLGWFVPTPEDRVPGHTGWALLVGNAGPGMFERFARERDPQRDTLDDWCREVLSRLAGELGASSHFPFDKPPHPFTRWGRRAGAGHASPLGLNIHPRFGLWSAYRALFTFTEAPALPPIDEHPSPCDNCAGRPCLSACPVGAFTGTGYDVDACARHLLTPAGRTCMEGGCLARRACPVGREHAYAPAQASFHMTAFLRARSLHGR